MTTRTVAIRCENENCWKWFEPEVLEAPRPSDSDEPTRFHAPTGYETICPHCGTRQPVPILDY